MGYEYEQSIGPNPSEMAAYAQGQNEQMMQGQTMSELAKQNTEFLKGFIDSGDVLIRVEHQLKGMVWKLGPDGREKWTPGGKRLVSDELLRNILSDLSGFCHKGIITSIYEENDILARLKNIGQAVVDNLLLYWHKRETITTRTKDANGVEIVQVIERRHFDPDDATKIYNMILFGQIEPTFRRALKGNTLRGLMQSIKHIESINQSQSQPSRTGLFGMFGKK